MDDDVNTEGAENTETPENDESDTSLVSGTPETDDTGEGDAGEETNADQDAAGSEDTPEDAGDGDADQEDGAPDEYADFTVPEGFEHLNDTLLAEAAPLFKEAGLSQKQAQGFVDAYAKSMQGQVESQTTAFIEANKENVAACKALPDIGGDKLDANVVYCAKAIDGEFTDKADATSFRALMDTGVGNHPLMFKLLASHGRLISEEKVPDGEPINDKPLPVTEEFYGKDGTGRAAET